MSLVVKDRVKETSTSTGTGGFTLEGAVYGFQSFASALTNGDTTYYAITDAGTGDFEVGLGSYSTGVLTRTTILESSNAGSAVNFGVGEKEVFITYPAEKAVYLDASNNIAVPGLVDGRDIAADGSKLDGIEAGATADQTGAEIKALYEAQANTNAYTDAEKSKLAGVEAGATADQTGAEIKSLYEAQANTNAYTDAEKTKLAGIESGADVTDATNVEAAGAVMDADIGVTVQAYDANIVSDASYVHTDNNYTTTEKNKLAGIEAGATADQTAAEIKTAYESNTNTNAYTDAEKTKLAGIEAGATADQTKADIDILGINAATLQGNNAAYFTGYTDTAIANLVDTAPSTLDTLNELAAALGDDPNFATTVTNNIATKVAKSGDTMTGGLSTTRLVSYEQDSTAPSAEDAAFDGFGVQGNRAANPIYLHNHGAGGIRISSNATLGTSNGVLVKDTETVVSGTLKVGTNTVFHDGYHPNADKWTTPRTIILSGDVSGSTTFDGSGNLTITTVVADDSHNHLISNIDGLQSNLNLKVNTSTQVTGSNGLTGGGALSGNVTIRHADTSSQTSVNNTGRTYIQSIDLDDYGHVTLISSATETAPFYSAGNGIDLNSNIFSVGAGGGLVQEPTGLAHADTSAQASLDALTGADVVSDINLDTYGHVTGLSTRTMTLSDLGYTGETNATADQTITAGSGLTGGGTGDVTISHADTSSQASVNNSNGSVIQDVTLDTYGHVTALTSVDLDDRYVNVTGDTMSGSLAINANDASITLNDTSGSPTDQGIRIRAESLDVNLPGSEGLGIIFEESPTNGSPDSTPAVITTGEFYAQSDQKVFHDNYHPNADKWTTARTITLGGDLSGSVSLDGSANVTLTATVADDSHNHDGRYYTETEADSRFVNVTGDTMSGSLTISGAGADLTIHNSTNATGAAVVFSDQSTPSQTGNITFYHSDSASPGSAYGSSFYIGTSETTGPAVILDADGDYFVGSDKVFNDGYHPNADKLTTARSIALTGDVTGSANFDGSANVSITATVADDSHTHDGRYYTETEADSRFVNVAGDTMTGSLGFGDNVLAQFGTSNDLQIFHDGSNSYISDAGTGDLNIRGSSVRIAGTTGVLGASFTNGGNSVLHYNGSQKLSTNSLGVGVTGLLQVNSVSVTGNIGVTGTVDGRDVAADGFKLDGIEAGATADQTITAGGGLSGGGTGNVTISHADTSTQASVNNSNGTVIQDVTLDGYGHVTALASVDLDGRYQQISDKEFFSITNTGTTSGVWTGSHPDITSYFDGMTIAFYQNNVAGASTTTLNINGLGAKTIYYANDTKLTTHYGPRALIMLQYDLEQDRFYAHDFYFSSADYELRWTTDVQAGAYVHGYQLLLEGADGKYYPVTEGGSTGNTNTVSTAEIRVGGNMLAYDSSTDYAADAIISTDYLWTSRQTGTMEYWNNRDAGWATPYNPIYLVGTINANGNFVLDNSSYTSFLTQDLPTTDDGKIYWYVGLMTDNYDDYRLVARHPMYIYKDGAVREWGQYANNSDKLDGQQGSYYLDWTNTTNKPDPTLTINGDASGSATFTDLGNATLTLTINNNSHDHTSLVAVDDRDMKPNTSGLAGSKRIGAFFSSKEGMTGTAGTDYHDVLVLDTYSDASAGGPNAITFDKGNAAGNPEAYLWKADYNGTTWGTGQRIFADNYHPNADKWTTARTLSLSGDASGSVSWDGSANATLSVTVADDSHNHTIANVDGLQTALDGKLSTTGKAADSDLLDGQDSSYYYPASNPNGYTTYSANQALDTTSNPTFNNAYIAGVIYHSGDTNTYMQFHAADQWRVVTGGAERFEINNSDVTVQSALKEKYVALSGTTPTIDVDTGGAFSLTTSGNTTFTFSAFTSALSSGFILELTAGGAHTITWPTSVDWAGGTAPDAPASGQTNIYVFWSRDGGTTWYGVLSSEAAA